MNADNVVRTILKTVLSKEKNNKKCELGIKASII